VGDFNGRQLPTLFFNFFLSKSFNRDDPHVKLDHSIGLCYLWLGFIGLGKLNDVCGEIWYR